MIYLVKKLYMHFLSYSKISNFIILIIVFLGILGANITFAQNKSQNDIVIEGNERIEKGTIFSYMTISSFEQATDTEINNSLKSLFATGLFSDIQIRRLKNKILVKVVENPIVRDVYFDGNKRLKDEDLIDEIQLRSRIAFTRAKVQSDVQKILQLYRVSGRFSAFVEPKVILLPKNRVDLIFEINEGPITKIKKIEFIGNKKFSDTKLKSIISSKQKSLLRPFTSSDRFDSDRFLFDRELLRIFYSKKGYADFKITSSSAELSPDNAMFYLIFKIDEGNQYTVRNIELKSNLETINLNYLYSQIEIEKEQIFNSKKIEDSIKNISFELGNQGFAFVDIYPKLSLDKKERKVDISFNISEGPKVYIERINITGNQRTVDKVIRREMLVSEGDPYNTQKIRKSLRNIRGLGFFKKVDVQNTAASDRDKGVLNVEVEEQSTGELSMGVGVSTSDGPVGDFTIRERNLFGKGQSLSTSLRLSGRTQEIDLSFTEPYFLDRKLAAGFDIFRKTADLQDESSFNSKVVGFNLRLKYPITDSLSGKLSYSLREDTIADFASDVSSFIRAEQGSDIQSSISHQIYYDQLDSVLYPSNGYSLLLDQTFAGIGGTKTFLKNSMEYRYYRQLTESIAGSISVNQGYIVGLGDDVSIVDRFFLGGGNMRGFKGGGVGPRDSLTGDSLGGNLFYTGTAQMKFPLVRDQDLPIKGLLFTQIGSLAVIDVEGTNLDDIGSPRISAGFGLAWESPVGPLRLDFSEVLKKENFDQTERIYFSFGARF